MVDDEGVIPTRSGHGIDRTHLHARGDIRCIPHRPCAAIKLNPLYLIVFRSKIAAQHDLGVRAVDHHHQVFRPKTVPHAIQSHIARQYTGVQAQHVGAGAADIGRVAQVVIAIAPTKKIGVVALPAMQPVVARAAIEDVISGFIERRIRVVEPSPIPQQAVIARAAG